MTHDIQIGDTILDGHQIGIVIDIIDNEYAHVKWYNAPYGNPHEHTTVHFISSPWLRESKQEWTEAQKRYIKNK